VVYKGFDEESGWEIPGDLRVIDAYLVVTNE
jgi:hypothetical protein